MTTTCENSLNKLLLVYFGTFSIFASYMGVLLSYTLFGMMFIKEPRAILMAPIFVTVGAVSMLVFSPVFARMARGDEGDNFVKPIDGVVIAISIVVGLAIDIVFGFFSLDVLSLPSTKIFGSLMSWSPGILVAVVVIWGYSFVFVVGLKKS